VEHLFQFDEQGSLVLNAAKLPLRVKSCARGNHGPLDIGPTGIGYFGDLGAIDGTEQRILLSRSGRTQLACDQ